MIALSQSVRLLIIIALSQEGVIALLNHGSRASLALTRHSPKVAKESYEKQFSKFSNGGRCPSQSTIRMSSKMKNEEGSPSSEINSEKNGQRNRYEQVLSKAGLSDEIASLKHFPDKRKISVNDVFCNRELGMNSVRAIGFDMDYTLAQYKQPEFDKLAFDGAKQKLVDELGYPKKVLDFEYDHEFWVRGLIIDTQRGNFLKIDRHKYVRVAYHGLTEITSSIRKSIYSRFINKAPSFTEKSFVNMDTLFQFVDAHLFASLIKMKDEDDNEFLDMKTYEEIYGHMRECVDLCHRDGVIKDEVALHPEKYIIPDDNLIPMLEGFRESGVKVFLLTNSYWEYTSVAMNYLYHQANVDTELKKKNEWLKLFDLVIVGSCKPAFLIDPYLNLFRVNPENGSLLNTDGVYEIKALGDNGAETFLERGKVFQGGNWQHLMAMLKTEAGEEILYVGDHLYSDVLRSKRTLGWRSTFIMPELEDEMRKYHEQLPVLDQIMELRKLRDELSTYGNSISCIINKGGGDDDEEDNAEKLKNMEEDDLKIKQALTQTAEKYHAAFHPKWGQMFLAGYQDSRLAYFVENYACLYTAKATNLGLSSINHTYRTSGEMLPHDKLLATNDTLFSTDDDSLDIDE